MVGQGLASLGQILIARRVGEGRGRARLGLAPRTGLLGLLLIGFCLDCDSSTGHCTWGLPTCFETRPRVTFSTSVHRRAQMGFSAGIHAMLMMLYAYFMGTARSKVLMVSMISGGDGEHSGRLDC